MSWLSKKWGELTGQNQKVDTDVIKDEYNQAFGGARDTYDKLEQRGFDMMDAGSDYNLSQKARMEASAKDNAALSARLGQRQAAMGGGAPAAAMAAQAQSGANKAQAGAIDSFNTYLQGAMGQGAGMASGAANNMAQMNQQQMNAISNQRLANAQIDSQATGFAANLIGTGLGTAFGGPMGGMIGGSLFGGQDGGYVESAYGNRGGMLSQVMGPDGIPMNIRTRIGGQYVGE